MKKENKVLFIAFLILFIAFLISNTELGKWIANIDSKATTGSFGVKIFIGSKEQNVESQSNGNITFSNDNVKQVITLVSGLNPAGGKANISLFNGTFPSEWDTNIPTLNEVNSRIRYFELNVTNQSTGSYKIYFNLSQSELNSISPANIRLFTFESSWSELSTTIIDSSSYPAQFYAVTTHFSKFLIGEKVSSESSSVSSVTGSSGGGGGRNLLQTGEVVKQVEPKKLTPIHIKGALFDIILTISEKYREIKQYDELVAELKLFNLLSKEPISVLLEYSITDDNNKTISISGYETKIVEEKAEFTKEITLPSDIHPGNYLLNVKLKYKNDIAISGYPFKVIQKEKTLNEKIVIISYIATFLLIIILIIGLIIKHKKKNQRDKKKQLNIIKEINRIKRGQ